MVHIFFKTNLMLQHDPGRLRGYSFDGFQNLTIIMFSKFKGIKRLLFSTGLKWTSSIIIKIKLGSQSSFHKTRQSES
jgi:hypothetical protein